jgi:hypothetical protein
MEKDKSLIDLLEKLKVKANFEEIEFVDYWDGDLCAIGLKRGNKLVYINTFNSDDKFDYDLELLDTVDIQNLNVIKEGRGVSEDILITEIKDFLLI